MRNTIVIILVAILLSSPVLAIGATPAKIVKIVDQDDPEFEIEPFSTNNASIEVFVQGHLAGRVKIDKEIYKPNETITGKILDFSDIRPGKHSVYIVLREVNLSEEGVSVLPEVAVLLTVQVPTPDALLFANWEMQLEKGSKDILTTVTLENVGNEETQVSDMILVVKDNDEQLGMVGFEPGTVEESSFKQFRSRYDGLASGALTPGVYTTELTAEYNDRLLEANKLMTFGSPLLNITFFEYLPESGNIHPVDVRISVVWNREIRVNVKLYRDDSTTPFVDENIQVSESVLQRYYLDTDQHGIPEKNLKAVVSYGPVSVSKQITLSEEIFAERKHRIWSYVLAITLIVILGAVILIYRIRKET